MMTRSCSAVLAGAILLAPTGPVLADAAAEGRLSGFNTVDYVEFPTGFLAGHTYTYDVTASGNGSNTLTVKAQQQKANGGWKTLRTIKIDVSGSGSGQYTVEDLRTGDEKMRYRFSRKIGTKAIDYEMEHDFTVFSG